MKILVCIKQVPDKNSKLTLDASRAAIVETELNWEINESDDYAIETGLRLKESLGEAEVIVCTLGPERARKAINTALAKGCDRGIHLADPDFQATDPLAVARALAAVAKSEEFSLVLCGTRSDDAGYGETPLLLAGLLNWPAMFLTMGVELGGAGLKLVRELEASRQELSELTLPAVLSVQSGIHEVRYTSLKGIMAAKKKPVAQPTPTELGLSVEKIGRLGSRLRVLELTPPIKKSTCELIEGNPEVATRSLVDKLRKEAKVI
jgi:electron transfer flavoprotein beta subunit